MEWENGTFSRQSLEMAAAGGEEVQTIDNNTYNNTTFRGVPKSELWTTTNNVKRAKASTNNRVNLAPRLRTLEEAHERAKELERSLNAEITNIRTDSKGNVFADMCQAAVCLVVIIGILASGIHGGGKRSRKQRKLRKLKRTRKAKN
jgi:hypothetical protein